MHKDIYSHKVTDRSIYNYKNFLNIIIIGLDNVASYRDSREYNIF